jgi:hypothetical protein
MALVRDKDGLTEKQRELARVMCENPSLSQADAGLKVYPHWTKKSAAVWVTRQLKLPNFQDYFNGLTGAAIVSIRKNRKAIATLRDVLLGNTRVMNARIGKYIKDDGTPDIEAIRKAPPGVIKSWKTKTRMVKAGEAELFIPEVEADFDMADAQQARNALLGHFQKVKGLGEQKPVINVAVIQQLPSGQKVEFIKGFLSEPEGEMESNQQ